MQGASVNEAMLDKHWLAFSITSLALKVKLERPSAPRDSHFEVQIL